jgi:LCP family protein required for cell wall assembly
MLHNAQPIIKIILLRKKLNWIILPFMWKFVIAFLVIISLGTLGFVLYRTNIELNDAGIDTGVTSPFSELAKEKEQNNLEEKYPLGKPINIMLLGIDRRSRNELSYRTDIMILLSVNPETNRVTLASIPRDLWYQGQKINGLYINEGWPTFQVAIEEITGQKPERFILTDFKDFSWIVDAMGGVPVEVERTFTDTSFPVDETKEYQTVSFAAGPEVLTGERALIYARSRKGNNGEGSDWARMRRQHNILKGMLEAVQQPGSLFKPMVVEEAFKTVTTGRMDTNLQIADAKYLWDFYKDKDDYIINSLFLDYDYLYSPPLEQYGGAWTVVPTDGDYSTFKTDLYNKLYAIEVPEKVTTSNSGDTVEEVSQTNKL